MDYKDKYLKYKKKYLELQNQLGGMDSYTETEYMGGFRKMKGGSKSDPDCSNCNVKDEIGLKGIIERTKKMEIEHLNRKFKDCDSRCVELQLLKVKFNEWNNSNKKDKIKLKELEITPLNLKEAGFSVNELKDEDFSAEELKNAGFSLKELEPEPKIFQIGFNKCGTRSITQLFHDSNVRSIHWDEGRLAIKMKHNFDHKKPLLTGYNKTTFFSDMEHIDTETLIYAHIDYYKLLDTQYPGSKFILNIRDRDAWIKSRLSHNYGEYIKELCKKYGLSREGIIQKWTDDWNNHISDVKSYFSDKPDKLLVFNIDTDNIQKIIDFFPEYKITNKVLPHQGKTSFF